MYVEYDSEMLYEDVAFPLEFSNGTISDSLGNKLADFEEEAPIFNLTGPYKDLDESMDSSSRYKLKGGEFIDSETDLKIGNIRGWTRLSQKIKPMTRQHNIAIYLLNRLNLA